jgi:hypothetical protein
LARSYSFWISASLTGWVRRYSPICALAISSARFNSICCWTSGRLATPLRLASWTSSSLLISASRTPARSCSLSFAPRATCCLITDSRRERGIATPFTVAIGPVAGTPAGAAAGLAGALAGSLVGSWASARAGATASNPAST